MIVIQQVQLQEQCYLQGSKILPLFSCSSLLLVHHICYIFPTLLPSVDYNPHLPSVYLLFNIYWDSKHKILLLCFPAKELQLLMIYLLHFMPLLSMFSFCACTEYTHTYFYRYDFVTIANQGHCSLRAHLLAHHSHILGLGLIYVTIIYTQFYFILFLITS